MKPPISTHILDTSRGVPANGVHVYLHKWVDGNWVLIKYGVTNEDGRCAELLERSTFQTGRYKFFFDVEKYFVSLNINSIYPSVEVVFDCIDINSHYHIPLLLNPFGYSTYKGS